MANNKEKRYVVTMDMYVYAENDYMARKRAHEIADNIKSPNNRAAVLDIVEQPFGKLGNRKLKDISKPSSGEEMPF
tara:strand:+ start:178 stop:405 length:228 start_codon:yes stop_codon:yes gene_type:complete